jgi:hypothetical protein
MFSVSLDKLLISDYTMLVNIHTHMEKEYMGATREKILEAAEKLLLLGFDPLHQTEQQFAEELVQGLLAAILPSRLGA